MAKSLTDEIQSLIDPQPEEDIENDQDARTLATKIFEVNLDAEDIPSSESEFSRIRRSQIANLSAYDKRYSGKKVDRDIFREEFEAENNSVDEEEILDGGFSDEDDDDDENTGEESIDQDDDGQSWVKDSAPSSMNIIKNQGEKLKNRAISVRNQLSLYESLIGMRIKFQKILTSANSLSSGDLNPENQATLGQIVMGLQKLQNLFLKIDKHVGPQMTELDNGETGKRKIKEVATEPVISKRFCLIQESYPKIIDEWHEKTKLVHSNMNMEKFKSFDVRPSQVISQVLMDKEKLMNRVRKRTGKDQSAAVDADETFDDSDFYHNILRQVLDVRQSGGSHETSLSSSKKLLEIQRLRSNAKKVVDTRASKGRKIRYDVHERLVNFMAPIDTTTMAEEAKNDLFKSLFGNFHHLVENTDCDKV